MSADDLTPDLFRIGLGRFQCYLWRGNDLAVLVDCGEPDTAAQLVAELQALGLAPKDLDLVVLTHFHDDHIGAAARLADSGAPTVVASSADAPVIRGERVGPAPVLGDGERQLHDQVAAGLRPASPVRVDVEVRDGDEPAPGVRVIAVPGHTDGSIAVHVPQVRAVFTGDVVTHYGGRVLPGVFNVDAAALAGSLDRLAELEVDIACFGHGDPLVGSAADGLQAAAATGRSAG
jgi:glyoxylase-like metal-dependent hydrolase (beta-lactamase superfamily II)